MSVVNRWICSHLRPGIPRAARGCVRREGGDDGDTLLSGDDGDTLLSGDDGDALLSGDGILLSTDSMPRMASANAGSLLSND